MKRFLLIFLVVGVVFIGGAMAFFLYGMDDIRQMGINDVDLSLVEDGSHTGAFRGSRWSNELEVTVQDHEIVEIRVVDDQLINRPDVTETLFERVKAAQSLEVDTVTEATITSKAYLKAMENALTQAVR